jgi:hypothetical protein
MQLRLRRPLIERRNIRNPPANQRAEPWLLKTGAPFRIAKYQIHLLIKTEIRGRSFSWRNQSPNVVSRSHGELEAIRGPRKERIFYLNPT